ncbi:MAG TPA: hypothetical protein VH985_08675 [Candidatus Binatia bacterium]|jgi:hypothetical protein
MLYAESLRAIGQSLETVHVESFRLEKEGDSYVVRSESLTPTRLWILSNSLGEDVGDSPPPDPKLTQLTVGEGSFCYRPPDIARLDAQERRKRQPPGFAPMPQKTLAQLLRTLGEYLDSKEATTFHISCAPDSMSVDYQMPAGISERKDFTVERLHKLALYSRFRRVQPTESH